MHWPDHYPTPIYGMDVVQHDCHRGHSASFPLHWESNKCLQETIMADNIIVMVMLRFAAASSRKSENSRPGSTLSENNLNSSEVANEAHTPGFELTKLKLSQPAGRFIL